MNSCVILRFYIQVISYGICHSLPELLHLVRNSLVASKLLHMVLFHSILGVFCTLHLFTRPLEKEECDTESRFGFSDSGSSWFSALAIPGCSLWIERGPRVISLSFFFFFLFLSAPVCTPGCLLLGGLC